jgi:hypothetical protein
VHGQSGITEAGAGLHLKALEVENRKERVDTLKMSHALLDKPTTWSTTMLGEKWVYTATYQWLLSWGYLFFSLYLEQSTSRKTILPRPAHWSFDLRGYVCGQEMFLGASLWTTRASFNRCTIRIECRRSADTNGFHLWMRLWLLWLLVLLLVVVDVENMGQLRVVNMSVMVHGLGRLLCRIIHRNKLQTKPKLRFLRKN